MKESKQSYSPYFTYQGKKYTLTNLVRQIETIEKIQNFLDHNLEVLESYELYIISSDNDSEEAYTEYIKLSESIDKWAQTYTTSTKTISKENPCDYYEISFNQALFMLLGLNISALDSELNYKGYIIDGNYKTKAFKNAVSIGEELVYNNACLDIDEYHWLSCQLKSESIQTEEFIKLAVEKEFLELTEDSSRVIPDNIAKALFKELKKHNFIPEDSVFDNQWCWQAKSDRLLAYLIVKMEAQGLLQFNDKYKTIESYIVKSKKRELRKVANEIQNKNPAGYKKIDEIVKILKSK